MYDPTPAVRHNQTQWALEVDGLALDLGCEPAALHAVLAVEVGTLPDHDAPPGPPAIRFELHQFGRRAALGPHLQLRDAPTPYHRDAQWYRLPGTDHQPAGLWRRVHSGDQADEWAALRVACSVDSTAALECTSWGVGQLLGHHHDRVGRVSVESMVAQAWRGVPAQLRAWARFLRTGTGLVEALQTHDWEAFAGEYNGRGPNVGTYAGMIERAYQVAVTEEVGNG